MTTFSPERNYVLIIIVVIIRLLSNIAFFAANIKILMASFKEKLDTISKMTLISIACVVVSYIVLIITAILEDETLESVVIRVVGGGILYVIWFLFVRNTLQNGKTIKEKGLQIKF